HTVESTFTDGLGGGRMLATTFSGLPGSPDLISTLRLYHNHPYGDISVTVRNSTPAPVTVETIRVVDAIGEPRINLGGSEDRDRVMADSYSEDPTIRIGSLAQAPHGVYFGVRSVLVYNTAAKQSLLLAALTSDRFLTVSHLRVTGGPAAPRIDSFTVDSTGTTEAVLGRDPIPPSQQVQLSLSLAPGKSLSSERLMVAGGPHYLQQLEAYGGAVRQLHNARVAAAAPMGWWSWTAFYGGINAGEVLTNVNWLADHLKRLGYDYFHIDEGYEYARGEYITANATQFPRGMRGIGYQIVHHGLTFAIWTAPFEASERSSVYQNHKNWLVHDAQGKPIFIGYVNRHADRLYALDTTNPGAQAYLRRTYRVLTQKWGVRYIKLDFMDSSAIEGYHYRPNTTALEAQRIGLRIIRDAVGNGVLLDKDGSPMLNPVGLVDEGRIAPDTGHSFQASMDADPNIAARFYMNETFYRSDPDAFSVSKQVEPQQTWHESKRGLSLRDAQVQIVLAAIAGGMYEIGDDLPTLGSEAGRLALVENQELIDMNRLGRAAVPLDLMTFPAQDLQPSIFFLHESARQAVLAVFNWTEQPRTHTLTLAQLGLPAAHPFRAYDVLDHDAPAALEGGALRIENQPPHSVRLIKLIDTSVAAAAPVVSTNAPAMVRTGEAFGLSATASGSPVPALVFRWDFGDGTGATGTEATHTYTKPASYAVTLTVTGIDGLTAHRSFTIRSSGLATTRFDFDHSRRYVPGPGM
ncbi:MAG: PKD domain-containing protein, partial [Terriglobia bacterium]